jgi:Tol biopolymer transport system component/DNA-binding winged helix-turn-helix (wHTH) protein
MPELIKPKPASVIRFGDYEFDRVRGILFLHGVAQKLQPQPLRALIFLADHAPEIVSREELAAHIWGNRVFVEVEQSLNYCIRQIRQVLEDSPSNPNFIETLPRQGYRFVGRVVRVTAAEEPQVIDAGSVQNSNDVEDSAKPAKESLSGTKLSSATISTVLTRRTVIGRAVGLAALTASGLWFEEWMRRKPRPDPVNVSIPIPRGAGTADPALVLGPAVVSPDGRTLVVSLRTNAGVQLFIRPLSSNQLIPMEGTMDGSLPFWSPDSHHIAFFARGKLNRISTAGGNVTVLCEAQKPRGGSWGRQGTIIFGLNTQSIFQVAENGGAVSVVTVLNRSAGENSHRFPVFLPDGNRFLYVVRNDNPDGTGIYLASTDQSTGPRKVLVAEESFTLARDPETGDHFLLSQQLGKVLAQRFDVGNGNVNGPSIRLIERGGAISASDTGVLVIRTGQKSSGLVWRNRHGTKIGTLGEGSNFWAVSLAPNGQFLAAAIHDAISGQFKVWLASLRDGLLEPFSEANHAGTVMWSADSSTIYYADFRKWKLFRRQVNPRGSEEYVCDLANESEVLAISPDGRYAVGEVAMMSAHTQAAWFDLQLLGKNARNSESWHVLARSDSHGPLPQFSSDGKWLAFSSSESGSTDVYVTDFPAALQRHRVSASGGRDPRWRQDTKELFFLSDDGDMMAAPIAVQGELRVGKPIQLFAANARSGSEGTLYDVSPDGQRFLLIDRGNSETEGAIEMILNWPSLLR